MTLTTTKAILLVSDTPSVENKSVVVLESVVTAQQEPSKRSIEEHKCFLLKKHNKTKLGTA